MIEPQEAWNSVADAWQRWWPTFEASAQIVSDRLVSLAGIRPGSHVLDFGTGIGEPALTAAKVVGPTGSVLGVDMASRMVEHARERAESLGLANAEFVVCDAAELDAERLGRPDGFDAAVSRWGLMLAPDPVDTARRIRGLMAPGALFAAAVWASAAEVPFIALVRTVVGEFVDLPPTDPDAPGPFRLGTPDALRTVLVDAGYQQVEIEDVEACFVFDSGEHYTKFSSELSSSLRLLLAEATEATASKILSAIAARAEDFREGDKIVLHNRALCARAVSKS